MEILEKNKSWYFTDEAINEFKGLKKTEDRARFIYFYLRTICSTHPIDKKDDESCLFKMAFLLADAVMNSKTSYSTYPKALDEQSNPFIAFLANLKRSYSKDKFYNILLSIVTQTVDPFNQHDKIYTADYNIATDFTNRIKNAEYFYDISPYQKCKEQYKEIMLEIIWLFG